MQVLGAKEHRMAHSPRRSPIVRLLSIVAIFGLVRPGFGSPGGVFDMDVPVLGGDPPITRDIKDGDASVSTQTGAFQYSYPIEIPQGRLGVQPLLTLSYSSQSPLSGGLAAGWSLQLPEIRLDPSQSRLASRSSDYVPRFVSTLSGGHELVEVVEPMAADVMEGYRGPYDGQYARFERLWATGERWRVRTTDGLTHEFGLPDHMENGHVEWWRIPITRTTDAFGNEINYFWRTQFDAYDHMVDLYLDRIEYTANPSHSLTSHARVFFDYASVERCQPTELPIGAKLEFDQFQKPRWSGARKLTAIRTEVRDGSGYRPVRTFTLTYDASAAQCTQAHGPLRMLTSIQESAVSPPPTSATTVMPAVTFTYGPLDRSPLYDNGEFTAPGGNFGDSLAGGDVQGPLGLPSLEVMLLDFDGDGRIDRLRNDPNAVGCGFQWERNTGTEFQPAIQHPRVALPTFRWGERGAGSSPATECSLAGQVSDIENRENETMCTTDNQGVYLSYRFIDLNADGLADLATGLNVDGRFYSTTPTLDGPGGPDPTPLPSEWMPVCPPGDGPMCPDLEPEDLVAPEICDGVENRYGCDIDEDAVEAVVDSAPEVPCDVLMMGTQDPNNPSNPCPGKWRQPLERCDGYVWQVYWNQGGAFAGTPETIVSPVPLDSNAADSSLGARRGGFSSTLHAIMDIDGDGFVDAVTKDSQGAPPSASNMWFVFRGDGTGHFHPRANGKVFLWQVPWEGQISRSSANFVPTNPPSGQDGTSAINGFSSLLDGTGDGNVDLLFRNDKPQVGDLLTTLYRNKGRGFLSGLSLDTDENQPEWLDVTNHGFVADAFRPTGSPIVTQGNRQSLAMPIDFDGDGRLDFYDGRNGGGAGLVRYGDGSGYLPAAGVLFDSHDLLHGRLEGATGEFRQLSDFLDINGDGVPEIVTSLGTGFQLYGDQPGRPVMRILRHIDNGAGASIDVSYKSSTDSTIDMPDVDDEEGMPSHAWVVDTMTMSEASGSQPPATTTYRYGTPVWNADQLGRYAFRGFEKTRAIRPLGAVTDSTFDYSVDWSGRLVETASYEKLENADGDLPDTIETTTWAPFLLFGATVTSFQPTTRKTWTCSNGQTRAQCQSTGALQVDSTTYVAQAAEGDPTGLVLLYYPRHVWRKRTGGIQDGDRKFLSDHLLYSAADYYRLRINLEQVYERVAGVDTLRSETRHTWVANGSGPPGAFHQKTNARPASGVAATELRYNETGTGLVTGRKKPLQFSTSSPARSTVSFDPTYPVQPIATKNEAEHTVYTQHDLGTGAVLSTKGPNTISCGGGCTTWEEVKTEIDGFGRPLRVYLTTGDTYQSELAQTFTYFDAPPQKVIEDRVITFGQPETTRVETTFDGFGRVRTRKEYRFEAGLPDPVDTFSYDAQGNLASLTTPDPSADSTATVTYQYIFDPFDRPARVIRPGLTPPAYADTTEVNWSYDGLATTRSEDAGGDGPEAVTTTTADVFGRLVRVDERTIDPAVATTTYVHDALDNVKTITDADGLVTSLDHDWRSRRTAITRGARVFRYEYDLNGNLLREIAPVPVGSDPVAYTTSIVYDDLDRPTSRLAGVRALSGAQLTSFGHSAIVYGYDQNPNGVGRLTSASSLVVQHSLQYDARGNVKTDTLGFTLPSSVGTLTDTRTITRSYNALGAVTSEFHGDDAVAPTQTITTYDRRGAAKTLTWQQMTPVVLGTAARNGAGLLLNITGSSVRQQWSYDRLGRVVDLKGASLPSATVRVNEGWSYYGMDDPESLTAFRGGLPQRVFTFSFDDRHQLIDADDDITGYTGHFEYLDSGRLDRAVIASTGAPMAPPRDVNYLYATAADRDPEAIRRLTSNIGAPPILYTSDESGNIRTRDEDGDGLNPFAFIYDGDDQQRRANAPSNDNELYYYDHTGQRVLAVSRLQNGTITKTRFWHASLEVEYPQSGPVETTVHLSLGPSPVARVINRATAKRVIHNQLGHFLAAFTPDGQALDAAFIYGPFGEILAQSGVTDDYLRRFNGKEQDQLSDLSYYGFRYFDPLSLTWTQADPLYRFVPDMAWDQPRRANLYTFSLQNPLRYLDPDGKKPLECEGTSSCAAGAELSFQDHQNERAAYAAEHPGYSVDWDVVGDVVVDTLNPLDNLIAAGEAIGEGAGAIAEGNFGDLPGIAAGGVAGLVAGKTAKVGLDKLGNAGAKVPRGAAGGMRAGKPHTRAARAKSREASGGICPRCKSPMTPPTKRTKGSKVDPREAQGDHVYPRSQGGDGATVDDMDNIETICARCNNLKSDTVETAD